jgi:predicted dehydrogenase
VSPNSHPTPPSRLSRRRFLQTSASAAAVTLASVPAVHAAGSDVLRIGLIGCGGRGTGAARQALRADAHVKLVAVGDMFRDKLDASLASLRQDADIAQKIDVRPDHCYVGFNAYQQVINGGVDVVLLCTPPHFRPIHFRAAVAARKHCFVEKPVAVDGPGVRKILEDVEVARRNRLAVVSGLCWRYHPAIREAMRRVHDGAIGQIVALQCVYNTGPLWVFRRQPGWTDMEWQLRNWLYFTWLSGDHNVEQHIHSLDKMQWAMRDQHPLRAVGLGGRQVRTGPEYGHIFDHHAVVYEYPGGIKCFSSCRQQAGCANEVKDYLMGTEGRCELDGSRGNANITGRRPWRATREQADNDMYQSEHNELFASIRAGNPINNGEYMARSTLTAIMGRMATYTGQVIEWEQALNSREDLTPPRYEFGPLAVPPVAMPGVTRRS